MKIAVLGDSDTVLGFRLAGVHEAYAFEETPLDIERLKNKLNELIEREDVGIILITERLAEKVEIPDVKLPIILQVPDKSGSKLGEKALREIVRRAIGVELKR
ncbi:archaeal/vacuolar-type H+-ATPase, subunit F [Thermococcus kodakarensis KOD1]|uniref:A-type ATP synthase subunit F n=1 Tax=Thermococcus kodakarensis (strain ATCC BAA-918 / JCM 12380 / KOD1) TaxID=69014 RepID=AATF_THEKO|nr:V-type ATP synthase subunit F [Thermococcus kodakarensis]Q5JIR4.1 RecName: Full=V-type ATP synthase subunit F; AltName: Full=V-ATPase subunit F [Thermococcus kodakarensis KOD1]WCN27540.1 V-type ATP synthase subunit F [Thermococcus kodakarensis]WCN29831.1 V-type ATP synthase subunit F [Thermococcus kodakarensis]BAD85790.1 archaeal/vacuolar-type H+-ATPase, subunit F [Thermococcus kodakarensis KOD1]